MSITLQIGNSDDRLSQKEWARFVKEICDLLTRHEVTVHFAGGSPSNAPWQNACWVFEANDAQAEILRHVVAGIRLSFKQDSAAWTEGRTLFV